eukprot:TRINITY_DN93960_c0_g1_i1.p1 TRINITY_DN93960_c0_g1~~TRINITY_DN93960_c0_g1_i1.p1  ORF type:complete len:162 (-),score=40.61 TRINITY_DN93960_c0_g1_i1:12-497(-)
MRWYILTMQRWQQLLKQPHAQVGEDARSDPLQVPGKYTTPLVQAGPPQAVAPEEAHLKQTIQRAMDAMQEADGMSVFSFRNSRLSFDSAEQDSMLGAILPVCSRDSPPRQGRKQLALQEALDQHAVLTRMLDEKRTLLESSLQRYKQLAALARSPESEMPM